MKRTNKRISEVFGEPWGNFLKLNQDSQWTTKTVKRQNMKKSAQIFAAMIFSIAMGLPLVVNAVSFSPIPGEREEKVAEGFMEVGTTAYLFHSGTAVVKNAIAVNDILTVYREEKSGDMKEVGKIKVLSFMGENYINGEVVEGEIKSGDIAKKGSVSCLVISEGDKGKLK